MTIMPKRRKCKDNPYTLYYYENSNKYICIFKDNNKNNQKVEITLDVYNALDAFELEDISHMHKFDKHIEHSELLEETLYHRMADNVYTFEKEIEQKILIENIEREFENLSKTQYRRMKKYFYENMTMEAIAKEEGCSKVAIKHSIDIAINKISKKIKI